MECFKNNEYVIYICIMNSEFHTIASDGLPEIYISPSKNTKLAQESSSKTVKVWDISPELSTTAVNKSKKSLASDLQFCRSIPSYARCATTVKPMSKSYSEYDKLNINDGKSKEVSFDKPPDPNLPRSEFLERKRGETPGSDSPGNFLLASTNLKLNKLKDAYLLNNNQIRNSLSIDVSDDSSVLAEAAVGLPQNSDSDSGIKSNFKHVLRSDKVVDLSQIRAVVGADSKATIPYTSSYKPHRNDDNNLQEQPSVSSSEVELNLLCRNSPAGISTPETISTNASTDNEGAVSVLNNIDVCRRPPVVGQSEEAMYLVKPRSFSNVVSHRKDLGSTDGEDSSSSSLKVALKKKYQYKIRHLTEACSIGSQSENTDSTSTVLDMKRLSFQGCENYEQDSNSGKCISKLMEPNFLVGGPISPRVVDKISSKTGNESCENKDFLSRLNACSDRTNISFDRRVDQDDSLPSVMSLESTHHPESSECLTPPSVTCMSISSMASSKKLEWDSGADVGYGKKSLEPKGSLFPTESLSTLERIAIGNYAAMMRTEPEGTTNIISKSKVKSSYKNRLHQNQQMHLQQNKQNLNVKRSSAKHKSIFLEKKNFYLEKGQKNRNSDFSSSEESNKDVSSKNTSIFNVRSPTSLPQKLFDYEKGASSHKPLKRETDNLAEIYRTKFDTVNKDDGHELENSFLDLKLFQSGKSSSVVSLPYYYITSGCGAPILNNSHKTRSLQMVNSKNFDNATSTCSRNKFANKISSIPCSEKKQVQMHSLDRNKVKAKTNFSLYENSNGNCTSKSETSITQNSSASSTGLYNDSSSLSLGSINNVLCSFSNKLKEYVLSLMNLGSFSNLGDYDKLQDYIEFVGVPSCNDEEVKLKQSVADIIMRMFSDISKADESVAALHSEIKAYKEDNSLSSTSCITSDNKEYEASEETEQVIKKVGSSTLEQNGNKSDSNKLASGTIKCIPYHPSSASRTYNFILTSEEKEDNGEAHNVIHDTHNDIPNSNHHRTNQHSISIDEEPHSSCKGVYQDRHGTLHIAHQPPGYNSNLDSHLSESASENEVVKFSNVQDANGSENNANSFGNRQTDNQRRNLAAVWTSTGSESAYETIRERHQNVGESLASSFEFYSTSPRDARLLGYVTSDAEKPTDVVYQDGNNISETCLDPCISDVTCGSRSTNKSTDRDPFSSSGSNQQQMYTKQKSPKKANKKIKQSRRRRVYSNKEESEEAFSNTSIVQIQRQKYVRKFKKYIHTLKKLERNLMPRLSDSLILSNSEQIKDMMESSDTSTYNTGTHNMDAVILSNQSLGSSRPESSAGISSTEEGKDESLVIHRTCSAALLQSYVKSPTSKSQKNLKSNNYSSSNLSSSEISPAHTSTMYTEKQKLRKSKPRIKKTIDEFDSNIKNCGKISDFRKLMSSTSGPGETRPFRYLLSKKMSSDIADGSITSDISPKQQNKFENNFIRELRKRSPVSEVIGDKQTHIEVVIGTHERHDQPINLEPENISISQSFTKASSTYEQDGHNYKKWQDRNLPEAEVENCLSEESFVWKTPSENSEKGKFPVTKDFGQMFPSNSNLLKDNSEVNDRKMFLAAGTQTGHSEVTSEVCISPIVSSSRGMSGNDCRDVGTKQKDPNVVNLGDISLLDQMEAKIKDNTSKINAALEEYDKQFGSLSKNLKPKKSDVSKTESFHEQENTESLSEKKDPLSVLNKHHFPTHHKEVDIAQDQNENELLISSTKKNGMKFVVNVCSRLGSKDTALNKSLAEELIELNKKNEIMTLQEALTLARPNYIKEAERRRMKIYRKQTIRRELQEHNQNVLAELPDNLKTPTILRKFLYKPDESPLFNYKTMRDQNRRLYQLLPEAQKQGILIKKASKTKAHRLMASYYSQKLRGKVLQGKVSHAHRDIVTPIH